VRAAEFEAVRDHWSCRTIADVLDRTTVAHAALGPKDRIQPILDGTGRDQRIHGVLRRAPSPERSP
jgi:hypothetical protein